MGPKVVVFHHSTPVGVDGFRTLLIGTNAVHPVIFIGKTSPRPSQHGYLYFFQSLNHIISYAVSVGNRRILTYPKSFIDAPAKMFGKVSINIFVYFPFLMSAFKVILTIFVPSYLIFQVFNNYIKCLI
jgi:hypothetical protein